ncbi:uncharacterized protein [Littorina saxatilis]|uniref:uncharacterized protein n=1 Tax=Littorina saxatilis TaxID=31220 RepID=UPI0038B53587
MGRRFYTPPTKDIGQSHRAASSPSSSTARRQLMTELEGSQPASSGTDNSGGGVGVRWAVQMTTTTSFSGWRTCSPDCPAHPHRMVIVPNRGLRGDSGHCWSVEAKLESNQCTHVQPFPQCHGNQLNNLVTQTLVQTRTSKSTYASPRL